MDTSDSFVVAEPVFTGGGSSSATFSLSTATAASAFADSTAIPVFQGSLSTPLSASAFEFFQYTNTKRYEFDVRLFTPTGYSFGASLGAKPLNQVVTSWAAAQALYPFLTSQDVFNSSTSYETDACAIKAAETAAYAAGGGDVLLPPCIGMINFPIVIRADRVRLRGAGNGVSNLMCGGCFSPTTFTGAIAGNTLTVSAFTSGPPLAVGMMIPAAQGFATTIFVGSISGNTLTVSSVTSGPALQVGSVIANLGHYTTISALGTGNGGAGTYTVSGTAQTVASGNLTAVLGPTTITALGTGVGGTGTYTVSVSQTLASGSHTAVPGPTTTAAIQFNAAGGSGAGYYAPFTTVGKDFTLYGINTPTYLPQLYYALKAPSAYNGGTAITFTASCTSGALTISAAPSSGFLMRDMVISGTGVPTGTFLTYQDPTTGLWQTNQPSMSFSSQTITVVDLGSPHFGFVQNSAGINFVNTYFAWLENVAMSGFDQTTTFGQHSFCLKFYNCNFGNNNSGICWKPTSINDQGENISWIHCCASNNNTNIDIDCSLTGYNYGTDIEIWGGSYDFPNVRWLRWVGGPTPYINYSGLPFNNPQPTEWQTSLKIYSGHFESQGSTSSGTQVPILYTEGNLLISGGKLQWDDATLPPCIASKMIGTYGSADISWADIFGFANTPLFGENGGGATAGNCFGRGNRGPTGSPIIFYQDAAGHVMGQSGAPDLITATTGTTANVAFQQKTVTLQGSSASNSVFNLPSGWMPGSFINFVTQDAYVWTFASGGTITVPSGKTAGGKMSGTAGAFVTAVTDGTNWFLAGALT